MSNVISQLDTIQSSYIGSYNGAMRAVQNENVTGSIEDVKSDISSLHKKTDDLVFEIKRIYSLIDHSSACPPSDSLYHSMGRLEEGISNVKTDITELKTSVPEIKTTLVLIDQKLCDNLPKLESCLDSVSSLDKQMQEVLKDNKWYRRLGVIIPTAILAACWAIVSNWDSIKSFFSSSFS